MGQKKRAFQAQLLLNAGISFFGRANFLVRRGLSRLGRALWPAAVGCVLHVFFFLIKARCTWALLHNKPPPCAAHVSAKLNAAPRTCFSAPRRLQTAGVAASARLKTPPDDHVAVAAAGGGTQTAVLTFPAHVPQLGFPAPVGPTRPGGIALGVLWQLKTHQWQILLPCKIIILLL